MGNISTDVFVTKNQVTGELEAVDLVTGELVVSSHAPPATSYAFNHAQALYICQLVREGKTLSQASAEPGMPELAVIMHWARRDKMFAEELKLARRDRAHIFHDKVLALAEAAQGAHKDHVPGYALAMKGYQWAAEKAAPDEFGNKVTHEGSTEKPIVMRVINTGITRDIKPQIVEVIEKGNTNVQQQARAEASREDEEGEGETD